MPDVPDSKDGAAADPPAVTTPPRRTGVRRIFIGLFILAALGAGAIGYWYAFIRGKVSTDDARIAGRMADVSPQVPGQIVKLLVKEGDRVSKGQLLFTLDTSSLQAQVAMAKAAVATASTGVDLARDQLEKALHGPRKAEIAAARAAEQRGAAQLDLAKTTWERDQKLFAQSAVTKVSLDKSHAEYEAAEASHQQALSSLRLLEQGTRSEDIDAARTAVKVAEAKVEQARASLDAALVAVGHASIAAPFDGVVVRRWLEPGSEAAPGRAVVTLFDPSTVRIDANIEEKSLHAIAIGDHVDIDVDAYPDLHLEGRVSQILQATNSEFSLIPAEGVSGTFIKVAQRIPIHVEILEPPADLLLGPGLSVEITIHLGSAPAAGPPASAERHP
jgi:membrane fusion protein, multidrug efflux system